MMYLLLSSTESMGEKLSAAGINTLICIAVVFLVLVFISLIISLFQFIPKMEAAIANRKAKKAEEKKIGEKAVEAAVSQIEANEIAEEVSMADEFELVAVIAAAVAAASGTSTDGFVVRSIRKVKRA